MRALRSLLSALALAGASCSDSDVIALRLQVNSDLSGTITASALAIPDAPGGVEGSFRGVEWTDRAVLACQRGRFSDLRMLTFEDLKFRVSVSEEMPRLRVILPRGDDARWFRVLAPPREQRRRVAETFDPTGELRDPAGSIKLELTLPGPVIASGVAPRGRGVEADRTKQTATLIVPVDAALAGGEALVWDVSWR
jgi:hypothetical protein